jgi:hypothetical protein
MAEDKDKNKKPKSKAWVIEQAQREVDTAQEAFDRAAPGVMKNRAKTELDRAKERLAELRQTGRRARKATTAVEEAQAAVDAAAKTADPKDDEAAQKQLRDAQRKAERTGEARDTARAEARQVFLSALGPQIAEAIREFPQLRDFFRQAIAEGWNADKQRLELNNSENPWYDWWQKRGSYWQAGFERQFRGSATKQEWVEDLDKAREIIDAAAKKAGVVLTEQERQNLSRRYWYSEWQADPAALESWMQQRRRKKEEQGTNVIDGEEPTVPVPVDRNSKIRELAALAEAYGLEYDANTLGVWADKILDPKVNTDGIEDDLFLEQLVTDAQGRYAPFADRISAGLNMRQIAGGYINEMSRLLEIPVGDIRLTPSQMNPLLLKALTDVDKETGEPKRTPLWEFAKQIRQSDDWQVTDNARDTYMSAASKFARALGLAG